MIVRFFLIVPMDQYSTRHLSTRGSVLVELALLIPVLAMLLMALVDWGLILDQRLLIREAVRAGARFAATITPQYYLVALPQPDVCAQIPDIAKRISETIWTESTQMRPFAPAVTFSAELEVFNTTAPTGIDMSDIDAPCMVRVRSQGNASCFFCGLANAIVPTFSLQASAAFRLEGKGGLCTLDGPSYDQCVTPPYIPPPGP